MVIAVALGFAAAKVLRGNPEASVRFHKLVAGLLIRAVCLYLVIRDLKAEQTI